MFEKIYQSVDGIQFWAIVIGLVVWVVIRAAQKGSCDCVKQGPSWKMPD